MTSRYATASITWTCEMYIYNYLSLYDITASSAEFRDTTTHHITSHYIKVNSTTRETDTQQTKTIHYTTHYHHVLPAGPLTAVAYFVTLFHSSQQLSLLPVGAAHLLCTAKPRFVHLSVRPRILIEIWLRSLGSRSCAQTTLASVAGWKNAVHPLTITEQLPKLVFRRNHYTNRCAAAVCAWVDRTDAPVAIQFSVEVVCHTRFAGIAIAAMWALVDSTLRSHLPMLRSRLDSKPRSRARVHPQSRVNMHFNSMLMSCCGRVGSNVKTSAWAGFCSCQQKHEKPQPDQEQRNWPALRKMTTANLRGFQSQCQYKSSKAADGQRCIHECLSTSCMMEERDGCSACEHGWGRDTHTKASSTKQQMLRSWCCMRVQRAARKTKRVVPRLHARILFRGSACAESHNSPAHDTCLDKHCQHYLRQNHHHLPPSRSHPPTVLHFHVLSFSFPLSSFLFLLSSLLSPLSSLLSSSPPLLLSSSPPLLLSSPHRFCSCVQEPSSHWQALHPPPFQSTSRRLCSISATDMKILSFTPISTSCLAVSWHLEILLGSSSLGFQREFVVSGDRVDFVLSLIHFFWFCFVVSTCTKQLPPVPSCGTRGLCFRFLVSRKSRTPGRKHTLTMQKQPQSGAPEPWGKLTARKTLS